MGFSRNIWIGVLILLIASASPTLLHATGVDVLSQTYTVSAPGCGGGEQSSPAPVSINCSMGGVIDFAITDGSIGPSNGFLSSSVEVVSGLGPGAHATAVIDFHTTVPVSLNLSTSGHYPGICSCFSEIELTDLTGGLSLFQSIGQFNPLFGFDLTGSFTFNLDALKDYSLEVTADTVGNDVASARVDYSVPDSSVPEPSSLTLLFPCLAALGIARSKLRI
jgi:hypothetical protein